MASVVKNMILKGLSGSLGNLLVIKHYRHRTVVCKYPQRSKTGFNQRQQEQQEKFKAAVAYAKSICSDAEKKKAFAQRVKPKGTVYHAAIREYMKSAGC